MGFSVAELAQARITAINDGTTTYFVNGKAYCLRPLYEQGRDYSYCKNPAGMGVGHGLNDGPCKHHGGGAWYNITNGRYSNVLKRQLNKRYSQYAADPSVLNITSELILLRTLMAEYLSIYQETHAIKALELTTNTLVQVTQVVERIERIQSSQTLTVAMTRLLMARAVDVAKRFLEGDELLQFIDAWELDVKGYLESPPENPVMELAPGRIRIDA